MSDYIKPADQLQQEGEPMPLWIHAAYIAALVFLMIVPGEADRQESERMSLSGYVNERADEHYRIYAAQQEGDR